MGERKRKMLRGVPVLAELRLGLGQICRDIRALLQAPSLSVDAQGIVVFAGIEGDLALLEQEIGTLAVRAIALSVPAQGDARRDQQASARKTAAQHPWPNSESSRCHHHSVDRAFWFG